MDDVSGDSEALFSMNLLWLKTFCSNHDHKSKLGAEIFIIGERSIYKYVEIGLGDVKLDIIEASLHVLDLPLDLFVQLLGLFIIWILVLGCDRQIKGCFRLAGACDICCSGLLLHILCFVVLFD